MRSSNHGPEKPEMRFPFGENWKRFLSSLQDRQIVEAVTSIKRMLEADELSAKTFLDVGSGSGLSSLAARRLGAEVYSFDCDAESVACTQYLKQKFFPDDPHWMVQEGSILDSAWLSSLKQYDIVYSWGVLHHTGAMWQALEHLDPLVADGGKLLIAIYNDQGIVSDFWRMIKRLYNYLPQRLRFVLTGPTLLCLWGPHTLKDLLRGKPYSTWRNYATLRGMSPWHDLVDWVGGLPFEVAKPGAIVDFYAVRGYELKKLSSAGRGLGCNEFVFKKL